MSLLLLQNRAFVLFKLSKLVTSGHPITSGNLKALCMFIDLDDRWLQLIGLQDLWHRFEKQVNQFLVWVMDEAKAFSCDVTSAGNEKGVFDHMESCKV